MDINSLSSPATGSVSATTSQTPAVVEANPIKQSEGSMASVDQKTNPVPQEVMQNEVESVNRVLDKLGLGVAFTIDENTKSSVVSVIDKSTDEVIKQFPNEGALRMMKNIQEYLNSVNERSSLTKEGLTGSLLNEII